MKRLENIKDLEHLEDFEVRFRVVAVVCKSNRINESNEKPQFIYDMAVKYNRDGLVSAIGPIVLQYNTDGQIKGLGKHAPPKRAYTRKILPEIMELGIKFECFGLGVYVEMINLRDPRGIGDVDEGYAVKYDSQYRIISFGAVDVFYKGKSKVPVKVGRLKDIWGFW